MRSTISVLLICFFFVFLFGKYAYDAQLYKKTRDLIATGPRNLFTTDMVKKLSVQTLGVLIAVIFLAPVAYTAYQAATVINGKVFGDICFRSGCQNKATESKTYINGNDSETLHYCKECIKGAPAEIQVSRGSNKKSRLDAKVLIPFGLLVIGTVAIGGFLLERGLHITLKGSQAAKTIGQMALASVGATSLVLLLKFLY